MSSLKNIIASTATIATMVAMVRNGKSHILTVSFSGEVRLRRISWEIAISR